MRFAAEETINENHATPKNILIHVEWSSSDRCANSMGGKKCRHRWKRAAFTHVLYWIDEVILAITFVAMVMARRQQ